MTTKNAPDQSPLGRSEASALEMVDPQFRDLMVDSLPTPADLDARSLLLAQHYSKSGTLEVAAGILALREAAGLTPS